MKEITLSYDSKKLLKKLDNVHRKYDDLALCNNIKRALSPDYLSYTSYDSLIRPFILDHYTRVNLKHRMTCISQ